MIAGHLQIKNDNYYMVLNYTDANGKRRQPWIPTGLPAKGNKRRAEKLLLDTRKSFVPPVVSKENEDISSDMLFADYMELWLEIIRSSVEKTTFSSYTQMVKGKIAPYFRNTGLTLDGIQAKHIQSFYLHELKTVSPGTVIHYHANIHKALKYAVKMDLIPFNPADKVERPKKQRYIADYYRQEELERLLEASKDHPYSLLIQMTAFYGLRRSEALGLKWDAIDFERDTITIKHIVTNAKIDGKSEIVCADRAKTKSSLRSLPLVSNIREKLLALREQQKENRRVCGNCYSKKYDGYVFVDAMGNIFNPRSVTANFSKLLEQNGVKVVISDANDIAGVYTAIRMIGTLMAKNDEAEALIADMQATFDEIAAKSEKSDKTIYFEVSPLQWGLWTAGSGTFMDELATMCGVTNAFADISGWQSISEEQVIERNPDYIVSIAGMGDTAVEEILGRDGWGDISAVKNGSVYNADSNAISRPGPRLKDAAIELYDFINGVEAEEVPAA